MSKGSEMKKKTRASALKAGACALTLPMMAGETAFAQPRQTTSLANHGGSFVGIRTDFACPPTGNARTNGHDPVNVNNTGNVSTGGRTNESGNYNNNNGNVGSVNQFRK